MTATFTATYSPEDNKLRLYADRRLDAETYARVKGMGFKWAPKQELFVAPRWTPDREDLCVELAGEIEPEFTTLAERAEAKAERLDALADKRQAQSSAFLRAADDLSQAFHMGQPILVGHHSERKARKTQERMHNAMDKSVKAAKSVQYWQWKAAGVESFANMKNSPRVRANRIKTLLAELRDLQRDVNHAQVCLSIWQKAETEDQIRKLSRAHVNGNALVSWERAKELEDGDISPQDFRTRCIESAKRAINSPKRRRWIDHILNRLAYERDLLGPVARYEGELSPVILQAFAREHGAMKPSAKAVPEGFALESAVPLPLHIASEKTVTLSADDWRDLMQSVGYTVPEKKDAKPPILNFRAGGQEVVAASGNIYGRKDTFRQIELTKEQYSKVYKEVRGTRLSACGTFRFKICKDPTSKEAYYMRPWVAVFLTDSKEHPAPESFKKQANAA